MDGEVYIDFDTPLDMLEAWNGPEVTGDKGKEIPTNQTNRNLFLHFIGRLPRRGPLLRDGRHRPAGPPQPGEGRAGPEALLRVRRRLGGQRGTWA